MLKILLKKQLAEIFRSYFYDAKKRVFRCGLFEARERCGSIFMERGHSPAR